MPKVLSQQKYFVATNIIFFVTKLLSRPAYFSRDVFVATKMILVAAPANDRVNPFTAVRSLKNLRAGSSTDTSADSIFFGPVTHQLSESMLCVLVKTLSHFSAKKKTKRIKAFKFRIFMGRFQTTS